MLSSHEAPANNPNADLTGDKLMKKTLTALLGLAFGTLAITPASASRQGGPHHRAGGGRGRGRRDGAPVGAAAERAPGAAVHHREPRRRRRRDRNQVGD